MSRSAALALLSLARENHPDAGIRAEIAAHVASTWSGDLAGTRRDEALATLATTAGTVLEPFVFEKRDEGGALELLAGAMRRGSRLRIVSRDKLVAEGGLVLEAGASDSLRASYRECVADRRREGSDNGEWVYAPALATTVGQVASPGPVLTASVTADEEGVRVWIGPLGPSAAVGQHLAVTGRTWPQNTDIGRIGARIRIEELGSERWAVVRADTPEATIRLTSAMADRTWLAVSFPSGFRTFAQATVRLDLPEAGRRVQLPVIRILGDAPTARLADWISTPEVSVDAPAPRVVRAIADWFGIVPEWLTPGLLEEYA